MKLKVELQTNRVKGICFHPNRSWIFYSTHNGSVHVYDYNIGVELFQYKVSNLPVRCIAVHPTQPIFACGTDDFNLVVYNWQKKIKLFSLSGHLDFIRSIEFHSVHPLLITSSDDSTARIWNWQSRCCVSILEDHTYFVMSSSFNPTLPVVATASLDECVRIFNIQPLLQTSMSKDIDSTFFSLDQTSNLVLENEEHPDGVNCVAWSSSGFQLISGGEDSIIKVYKYENDELAVISTINAHTAGISGLTYHQQSGNIISSSEDFTIRIFDSSTFLEIGKHEISGSRFWCVASHPRDALIAAGHDQGLLIFKTNKERTPFDVQGSSVSWLQDNELHVVDIINKVTEKPIPLKKFSSMISWNPFRNIALISYIPTNEDPYFEAIDFQQKNNPLKINGLSCIWLSRSIIAYLSISRDRIFISELGSSNPKGVNIPRAIKLISATAQKIYIITRTSIILYDTIKLLILNEIQFNDCKLISFNEEKTKICASSSHILLTCKPDFSEPFFFNESCKVKSLCFNGEAVLYTTRSHLKYIIVENGGVVCSLPRVLYILKAQKELAWFVTRDGVLFKREIELGEVHLKLALRRSNLDDSLAARKIVSEKPPVGFSVMEYAANSGRFDIASSLARDPKVKFEMCLKSGDFETASKIANEINEKSIYQKLGNLSLQNGKLLLAEISFKKAFDFESLSFLYLITGSQEKLHNLSNQEPTPLNLIWSNNDKGLTELLINYAPGISKEFESNFSSNNLISFGTSILQDWPTIGSSFVQIPKGINMDEDSQWPNSSENSDDNINLNNEEDGWEIAITDEIIDSSQPNDIAFIAPQKTESKINLLLKNSSTVGELSAIGQFSEALLLLKSQIPIKNPLPLKELFISNYISCNGFINSSYTSFSIPIHYEFRNSIYPSVPNYLNLIDEIIKNALAAFSKGKFSECYTLCINAIRRSIVSTVSTKEESQKISDFINVAMNYALGVSMEIERKSESNLSRSLELAVYFTHVKLLPSHELLALQSSMRLAMKLKNFITAKSLIQRLLDLSPPEKIAAPAKQYLQTAISNPSNELEIDYNDRNPFVVCSKSHKPIYRGKSSVTCPICGCFSMAHYSGSVCSICDIAEIGAKSNGLVFLRNFIK